MMAVSEQPPTDLSIVSDSSEKVGVGLMLLAAPDSLTDSLAKHLLAANDIAGGDQIVDAIRHCNFVVQRGSEWRFDERARFHLQGRLSEFPELTERVHEELLFLGSSQGITDVDLPSYLREGPGIAYHAAALDPGDGLRDYAQVAQYGSAQTSWLCQKLAAEQADRGLFSREAPELLLLQAMVHYRDHRWRHAEPIFKRLAKRNESSLPVAIALHLLGRRDLDDGKLRERCIRQLRRSRRIGIELGDDMHVAHSSHSLALGLLIQDSVKGRLEALDLLQTSYDILSQLEDQFGLAQVLNTWGRELATGKHSSSERNEGLAMLQRSLAIGVAMRHREHQASVYLSLAAASQGAQARDYLEQAEKMGVRTYTLRIERERKALGKGGRR
jgi:hypothetical protein